MKSARFCLFLLILLSGCKKAELPVITTGNISSITQTSAICKGYVFSQGSCKVISKGICWSTSGELTIFDNIVTVDSSTTFTIKVTGLETNTTYYVRSFAINCAGTGYGETKSFTTDPPYLPTVETSGVTSITKTTAKSGGLVTSDGASRIIDCGICWGTSLLPTLSDNHISTGAVTGQYSILITGLKPNTDYFARAYATNNVGTSYGLSYLFSTCFEPNPDYPVDPKYPTTFYKPDPVTLSQKKAAFAARNRYLQTSLNDFGFCSTLRVKAEFPPYIGNISQDQAIGIVKDFFSKNPSETGVKNTGDISFSKIQRLSYDASDRWNFTVPGQKVKNLEVRWNNISIDVTNGEITYSDGNWYPDLYVPENFCVDQEQAKSLILGRAITLGYEGETGAIDIVSQDDCNSSSVSSLIIVVNKDNIIKLHVVWEIHLNSHSFILYVDAMTGEIVSRTSTIIWN